MRLFVSSLNFWDKAWWFLSLRVFGLLSSSLLLFPQCFSQYVLRPSSDVCRTWEPSWNFELHPLLNPQGLQVQAWLQASNNTGIFITCTKLWLMELEPATPVDSIKDVVQSSMKAPEFDKHLKKARGHVSQNDMEITMKTIVWKPLMIKETVCISFPTNILRKGMNPCLPSSRYG